METEGYGLQGAMDRAGEMCQQAMDVFLDNETKIPSWSVEVDNDVESYVQGLREWIVGSVHWNFETERYFGERGAEIKKTRTVELLPKVHHA